MPETPTIRNAYEPRAKTSGLSWEQWQEMLASRTHARRLMKLDELTELAAFLASDRGSGMTGTTVNLTLGSVDD
jgi:NAD(P)-dependent dehydrogenase (short-subunit alcohol dehydrogenase family)